MARIDSFFKLMGEQKASDLHLATNNPPMLRINGELVRVDYPPLQNDELKAMVYEIAPEAKIKLGPPLNGIDGRKAGTFEGFNYSPANKSSGIVWDEQAFDKYIRAPMQEMPGTRMAFVGVKNDKDIGDLWAYLKQFGPDGAKK